jgi:hypothetical protein
MWLDKNKYMVGPASVFTVEFMVEAAGSSGMLVSHRRIHWYCSNFQQAKIFRIIFLKSLIEES